MTVSILIPCHNNAKDLADLLPCLRIQTYQDCRVIVINDGSTDETDDVLRRLCPEATVLRGDGSLWWSGANAMGIDHVLMKSRDSDFVLLLNNDVLVERDYVRLIVDASLENRRAIVGSLMIDAKNPQYCEGGILQDRRLRLTVNRDLRRIQLTRWDLNVDVLPGRGTLVPIEVFHAIGNLKAKQLPQYGSDYEFTSRAKRAGFQIMLSHEAKVFAKLDITGLSVPQDRTITLREARKLLFDKKSITNLLYYPRYAWYCSKGIYKAINTVRSHLDILVCVLEATCLRPLVRAIRFPFNAVGWTLRWSEWAIWKFWTFILISYPVKVTDVWAYGLSPERLLELGILEEKLHRDTRYLRFCRDYRSRTRTCSPEERSRIQRLRRRSFSHVYKIGIETEKVTRIFKRAVTGH